MDAFIIIVVNGVETKINLVEAPSTRNTKRNRYILPDFENEIVSTYKGGKYLYISNTKSGKKEKKQVSRKTETKKIETKEVSVTKVSKETVKSKLFDDYVSGNITARELKELSKTI